ncbi:MAG TPA: hypothetical protein VN515_06880 [Terriglobales bacterium]|nr:hypothetical protein [Terriglobales bacterium]
MAIRFTDDEIAQLLAEPKPLPADFRQRLRLHQKRGHREAALGITGADGTQFWLLARQSSLNVLDFSIILAVTPVGSGSRFRLRRHNGKSHEHSNAIERDLFYDFHIHMATQRYQELGMKEDSYAEPTERYSDLVGALECFYADCAILLSPGGQETLFPEDVI